MLLLYAACTWLQTAVMFPAASGAATTETTANKDLMGSETG